MADTKISELDAAAALTGAEIVPVVQGGDTVRTTAQAIADLGGGGGGGVETGAFTGTFTLNDFVSPVNVTRPIYYQVVDNLVTLYLATDFMLNLGSSNGGILVMAGVPAELIPEASRSTACVVEGDPFLAGENRMPGMAVVSNDGSIFFYHGTNIPISNDGTPFGDTFTQYAGLRGGWTITYPLADIPAEHVSPITDVTVGSGFAGGALGWNTSPSFGSANPSIAGSVIDGIYLGISVSPNLFTFHTAGSQSALLAEIRAHAFVRVEHDGGTIDLDTADAANEGFSEVAFSATDYPALTGMWTLSGVYSVSFIN